MAQNEQVLAQEVLDQAENKKLVDLLLKYKRYKLEAEACEEAMAELKTEIGDIAMSAGADSLKAPDGSSVTIRQPSVRKTLNQKRLITKLAGIGVAASIMDDCYDETKVDWGVTIRLSKD